MRYSYATVALPTLTPAEACSELGAAGFTGIEWKVGTAPYAKNSTVRDFLDGNLCTLDETLEAACLGADAARGPAWPWWGSRLTSRRARRRSSGS